MIIPMVCFTCGEPIAHLYETYLEYIGKINEEQEKNTNIEEKSKEFIALSKLKIGNDCCRRMFICQHDMYNKL